MDKPAAHTHPPELSWLRDLDWGYNQDVAVMIEIGALLSQKPGVCGGRLCVAGTGISVRRIAVLHNQGMTVEEIVGNWGYISVAQVHAALAYYHANKAEMDAALEEEQREHDRLAMLHPRKP